MNKKVKCINNSPNFVSPLNYDEYQVSFPK